MKVTAAPASPAAIAPGMSVDVIAAKLLSQYDANRSGYITFDPVPENRINGKNAPEVFRTSEGRIFSIAPLVRLADSEGDGSNGSRIGELIDVIKRYDQGPDVCGPSGSVRKGDGRLDGIEYQRYLSDFGEIQVSPDEVR